MKRKHIRKNPSPAKPAAPNLVEDREIVIIFDSRRTTRRADSQALSVHALPGSARG